MKKKMKIVAIIPARYASSRFPGKPLADICGKPMIWWVYKQVCKVEELQGEIYIATDDERILHECKRYGMNVIMTSNTCEDHIVRIAEVSNKISADYYICINGDEPLIDPNSIKKCFPDNVCNDTFYFGGAMRKITSPVQAMDNANLKIVVNENNQCLYISRMPIPYPKGSLDVTYNKYVGIECFNKIALDFYINTKQGILEKIEDIDHLRFLENNMRLIFQYVDSESISVDNPKDLEYVKTIIAAQIDRGESVNE